MKQIDFLTELRRQIQEVFSKKNYRGEPLYKTLKSELMSLGYWRNRERGNPVKGYQAMKDKVDK
jgi:hypothetical protein